MRLLYTNTDFIVLQHIIDDIKQTLTENPTVQNELDYSFVAVIHLSGVSKNDYLNAGFVKKFKKELNTDLIIKFVRIRLKIYYITTCKATKLNVATPLYPELHYKELVKGCSRTNIARLSLDYYVRMYKENNAHVIVN